jgi:hypothetical protein
MNSFSVLSVGYRVENEKRKTFKYFSHNDEKHFFSAAAADVGMRNEERRALT